MLLLWHINDDILGEANKTSTGKKVRCSLSAFPRRRNLTSSMAAFQHLRRGAVVYKVRAAISEQKAGSPPGNAGCVITHTHTHTGEV